MGAKHREERKRLKYVARQLGVRENEFSELKLTITKAEHRRRLIAHEFSQHRRRRQQDIITAMSESICEQIDEEILVEMLMTLRQEES